MEKSERIRRLENANIIEDYHVRLSAAKLGYPVTAFILARPNGDARVCGLLKSIAHERLAMLVHELPAVEVC